MTADTAREIALDVLSSHGYADDASGEYGVCFCGEVHADSFDMAVHILDKLIEKQIGLFVEHEVEGLDYSQIQREYEGWLNPEIRER